MGPLPYQPLFLSFFAESCYLDSNAKALNAALSDNRPKEGSKVCTMARTRRTRRV